MKVAGSASGGVENYALEFDGNGVESSDPDYVEFLSSPDLNIDGDKLTISLWIYPINIGSVQYYLVSNDRDLSGGGYDFFIDSNNRLNGRIWYGTSNSLAVSGVSTLSNDHWYHVAMVYDGEKITLYLNGVEDVVSSTIPNSNIYSSNYDFHIGVLAYNADPIDAWYEFSGKIDDVAVYSDDLSQESIVNLMNDGPYEGDNGLVEYWPLDEGSGNSVVGVNGNVGGIIGTQNWVSANN